MRAAVAQMHGALIEQAPRASCACPRFARRRVAPAQRDPEGSAMPWRCRSFSAADSDLLARKKAASIVRLQRVAAFRRAGSLRHLFSRTQHVTPCPRSRKANSSRPAATPPSRAITAAEAWRSFIPRAFAVKSHGARSASRSSSVNVRTAWRYSGFASVRLPPRNRACSIRCSRVAFIPESRRTNCYFSRNPRARSACLGARNHFRTRSLHGVQMNSPRERRKQRGMRRLHAAQKILHVRPRFEHQRATQFAIHCDAPR